LHIPTGIFVGGAEVTLEEVAEELKVLLVEWQV